VINVTTLWDDFNGIIPESLGDLPNLDELTLHDNQLDGIIPSSLCKYHLNLFLCDIPTAAIAKEHKNVSEVILQLVNQIINVLFSLIGI